MALLALTRRPGGGTWARPASAHRVPGSSRGNDLGSLGSDQKWKSRGQVLSRGHWAMA